MNSTTGHNPVDLENLTASEQTWSDRALASLTMHHDVEAGHAKAAVADAIELSRTSGDDPEEFHGPASEWAGGLAGYWRESAPVAETEAGTTTAEPDPRYLAPPASADRLFEADEPLDAKVLVIAGLGFAVFVSIAFCIMFLFSDGLTRSFTPGLFAAPFALGTAIAITAGVHDTLRRKKSHGWAVAGTTVTVIVCSLLVAGLFSLLSSPSFTFSSFAILIPGVVAVLVAVGLLKIWPSPDPSRANASPGIPLHAEGAPHPDVEWREEFVRAARARSDRSEKEIQRLANEAHAHAREQGTTIGYEFGEPAAYARSLATIDVFQARRRFWFNLAIALVLTTAVVWNWIQGSFTNNLLFTGIMGAWLGLAVWGVVSAYRSYAKAKRG